MLFASVETFVHDAFSKSRKVFLTEIFREVNVEDHKVNARVVENCSRHKRCNIYFARDPRAG